MTATAPPPPPLAPRWTLHEKMQVHDVLELRRKRPCTSPRPRVNRLLHRWWWGGGDVARSLAAVVCSDPLAEEPRICGRLCFRTHRLALGRDSSSPASTPSTSASTIALWVANAALGHSLVVRIVRDRCLEWGNGFCALQLDSLCGLILVRCVPFCEALWYIREAVGSLLVPRHGHWGAAPCYFGELYRVLCYRLSDWRRRSWGTWLDDDLQIFCRLLWADDTWRLARMNRGSSS